MTAMTSIVTDRIDLIDIGLNTRPLVERILLDVGQQVEKKRTEAARVAAAEPAELGRHPAHGTVEILRGQSDLLQVVLALGAPRRTAGRLHRRQQQGDQHTDDHNHHQ